MDFKTKKSALNYINDLIDKKLSKLNDNDENGDYKIHDFDDESMLYQSFKSWRDSEIYGDGVKIKDIQLINKDINLSFIGYFPKGTKIEKQKYASCFICIRGEFELKIDDDMYQIGDFSEVCVSKESFHSLYFKKDSYVIIYSDKKI